MSSIIEIKNCTFQYPEAERTALSGLSLEIERGSFVAVLGHNGSGKSTLAKLMNGLLIPTEGQVLVNGLDTANEANILDVRRTVGMVFQNPDNQIVANVVEDDVAFAPENLGVPSEEIRVRVDEALKAVGMYEFRMHAPHLLSGGQKQRVAIAGVIAMQPDCIVLDEPPAMLDPAGRAEIISTAHKLCREKGITVVLITHHMNECVDADRLIVMSDGHLVADGKPEAVFSQVELLRQERLTTPETTALLYALNQKGWNLPLEALHTEECAQVIASALPENLPDVLMQSEREEVLPTGAVKLEIQGLSHRYSVGTPFEKVAVENIHLSFGENQIIGLIGHTGSGKSTLIQHLNGLLKPTEGKILLDGRDIHESKALLRQARFRVGLVFQYPEYQLFEEAVFRDIAFGPKNMGLSEAEIDERVREAARFTGITEDVFERSPLELSGGQKRRVAIAGVIAMRPEILVLDEPTAGLDPQGCASILENIIEYHRQTKATVVIVTHSMEDISRIADRLVVMNRSHMAMEGVPDEIFAHASELEAMGLAVPESARLAARLRELGVPLPENIYTTERLLACILALKGGAAQ